MRRSKKLIGFTLKDKRIVNVYESPVHKKRVYRSGKKLKKFKRTYKTKGEAKKALKSSRKLKRRTTRRFRYTEDIETICRRCGYTHGTWNNCMECATRATQWNKRATHPSSLRESRRLATNAMNKMDILKPAYDKFGGEATINALPSRFRVGGPAAAEEEEIHTERSREEESFYQELEFVRTKLCYMHSQSMFLKTLRALESQNTKKDKLSYLHRKYGISLREVPSDAELQRLASQSCFKQFKEKTDQIQRKIERTKKWKKGIEELTTIVDDVGRRVEQEKRIDEEELGRKLAVPTLERGWSALGEEEDQTVKGIGDLIEGRVSVDEGSLHSFRFLAEDAKWKLTFGKRSSPPSSVYYRTDEELIDIVTNFMILLNNEDPNLRNLNKITIQLTEREYRNTPPSPFDNDIFEIKYVHDETGRRENLIITDMSDDGVYEYYGSLQEQINRMQEYVQAERTGISQHSFRFPAENAKWKLTIGKRSAPPSNLYYRTDEELIDRVTTFMILWNNEDPNLRNLNKITIQLGEYRNAPPSPFDNDIFEITNTHETARRPRMSELIEGSSENLIITYISPEDGTEEYYGSLREQVDRMAEYVEVAGGSFIED